MLCLGDSLPLLTLTHMNRILQILLLFFTTTSLRFLLALFFYYIHVSVLMLYSTEEHDGVPAVYTAPATTLRPVPQTVPVIARLLPQPLLSGEEPSRLSTAQEVSAGTPRHDRTGQLSFTHPALL